jgi:hypothetical protein
MKLLEVWLPCLWLAVHLITLIQHACKDSRFIVHNVIYCTVHRCKYLKNLYFSTSTAPSVLGKKPCFEFLKNVFAWIYFVIRLAV